MRLFKKDFTILSKKNMDFKIRRDERKKKQFEMSIRMYSRTPSEVFLYQSLFPNNDMDGDPFNDPESIEQIRKEFTELLDTSPNERSVLNFIKDREAYFIITSILQDYDFGHHGIFCFKEFEFPSTHKADFLIIGLNSQGHHFVFVELESPEGRITTKDGEFGEVIRKGIAQAEEWQIWLNTNFSTLKLIFEKALGPEGRFPKEFLEYDPSRMHFVVVAGRRKHFSDKTYLKGRIKRDKEKIRVLHYDNLIDKIGEHLRLRFQHSN